ncbi:S-adenosyl-L-methionine-dependent methyltransferase [Limtongia smithiae]|uniref:S-adenosyl-L-methionine-dependent methyltransferase n=1 Tax=Limtongia smithiae TaxID=1125753 RepID=UPI0034CEF62D
MPPKELADIAAAASTLAVKLAKTPKPRTPRVPGSAIAKPPATTTTSTTSTTVTKPAAITATAVAAAAGSAGISPKPRRKRTPSAEVAAAKAAKAAAAAAAAKAAKKPLAAGELPASWRSVLGKAYDRQSVVNFEKSEEIVQSLELDTVYKPGEFEIVDIYPGTGVWSRALNLATRPKTHIMLERGDGYFSWIKNYNADLACTPIQVDGYKWQVYTSLLKYKGITPTKLPFDRINPSLLITGQLTSPQGAQLLTQFINCVANRNWLQRFGLVRMLFWVREDEVGRVIADPRDRKNMNRASMVASMFTDITPRACAYGMEAGERVTIPDMYKLRVAEPLEIPHTDVYTKAGLVLLDIQPTPQQPWESKISSLTVDYVLRNLFVLPKATLREGLNNLGAGAQEFFEADVGELYDTPVLELREQDFVRVFETFEKWPFKPEFLLEMNTDNMLGLVTAAGGGGEAEFA